MTDTPTRRPAVLVLTLVAFTLFLAGCERRPADPVMPSTSPGTAAPGTSSPTTPSTTTPGTLPDSAASAVSR